MTVRAVVKQADIERAVRGAVRGAGLQPGTFEIRIALNGSVRILPASGHAVQDDDPDAELRQFLTDDGDG